MLSFLRRVLPVSLSLLLLILFILPGDLWAKGFEITPFGGYRFGGSFDTSTGGSLRLDDSGSYGVIIGMDYQENTQLEFLYSHQKSPLKQNEGIFSGETLFDLGVDYFQIGGTYLWDYDRLVPFLSGGLGAAYLNPDASEYSSVTKFAMSLGGGVKLYATEHIGLRLEGRGYATFMNSGGAIFCGGDTGGCQVFVTSDVWMQFEVLAGVIFRF
jgi:hypothetical protein